MIALIINSFRLTTLVRRGEKRDMPGALPVAFNT